MMSSLMVGLRARTALVGLLLFGATLGTAFGQAVNLLYVPNSSGPAPGPGIAVYKIDNAGNLSGLQTFTTAQPAQEVAVTPNGKFVFVATNQFIDAFTVDPTGTLTTGSITATGGGLKAAVIDPSGSFLYVSNTSGDQILGYSISSTGTLTNVANVSPGAGTGPLGLAIDSSNHLYAALNSGSVAQYNISGGALAAIAAPVVSSPLANRLAIVGGFLFVTGFGTGGVVTRHAIGAGGALGAAATAATIPTGFPVGVTPNTAGTTLFVADNLQNNVIAYPIGGGGALGTGVVTAAGLGPAGFAIDPSGNFLFVTNNTASSVTKFSGAASGTLTGPVTTTSGIVTPVFPFSHAAPAAPATIPALSTWVLILLGTLLAASSALLYRKAYR